MKTPLPTPERVRLTISVTPEVHATFQKLAKASSMSIGRAMGEWLGDTSEAAAFMGAKLLEARAAPKLVMQEMHAYALGMADETSAILSKMRTEGGSALGKRSAAAALPSPPPSNTGGKVPKTNAKGRK